MTEIVERVSLEENKGNLLAAYSRYSSYVRKIEAYVRERSKISLAGYKFYTEYGKFFDEMEQIPWKLSAASDEERKAFDDLLEGCAKNIPEACYISVKYNFDNPHTKGCFDSLPDGLQTGSDILMFPNLYEYYLAAFEKNAMLRDTPFIIDGRMKIKYNAELFGDGDLTVAEAFDSVDFCEKFKSMLYTATLLDKCKDENPRLDLIHNEAFASRFVQPLETIILNAMARNAEISRDIISDIYKSKKSIRKAEENGLIPSAQNLRNYLKIRHLIHHQCDSLGAYAGFTTSLSETRKNQRNEYLKIYQQLFDKDLFGRLDTYVEIMDDFRPLVQHFYPNFISRKKDESVSKFISRIKDYHRKNPDDNLILELNYDSKNSKSDQMMKNIKKLFPEASIIDNPEVKIETIFGEMENYSRLNTYLHTYQEMENLLGLYSLAHGVSVSTLDSVKLMVQKQDLDKSFYDKIVKIRAKRNKLSHNYFTSEMAEMFTSDTSELTDVYTKINSVVAKLPKGTLVEGNIYKFTHPDGKVVNVDFAERKIIRTDIVQRLEKNKNKTLETDKTNANTLSLPDGTHINYDSRKMVFADKSILYFNSPQHFSLVINDNISGKNAKLLLDLDDFTVKKFIYKGRPIAFTPGDVLNHVPNYIVRTDRFGRLSSVIHKTQSGVKHTTQFNANKRPSICLPDGTVLDMFYGKPEVCGKQQTQQKNNGGRS